MGSDERVGHLQRSGLVEDSDLLCVYNFYDSRSVLLSWDSHAPNSQSYHWVLSVRSFSESPCRKTVNPFAHILHLFSPALSSFSSFNPFSTPLLWLLHSVSFSFLSRSLSRQPPSLSPFRENSATILSSQCKLHTTRNSCLSKRIGGDLGISRVFTWWTCL